VAHPVNKQKLNQMPLALQFFSNDTQKFFLGNTDLYREPNNLN